MRHPYLDIPELSGLHGSGPLVRIPMHQDVPFTPRVRALVDTTEFQRLGHISQLGLASRVYPGATHTRFEHSLGVFQNALEYLWQLGRDERFAAIVSPRQAEMLLAAALLHDLGHWPFCHPIEDLDLPDIPHHEHFAAQFLSRDREIGQVLLSEWHIDPEEVLDLLVKKTDSPALNLLRSILSGPVDIDKMDYLERDSLHAGVPYGRNFDRQRLIRSLVVNEPGDGMAISSKGRTAAELMVFARYVMFSEVYWHHAVRSATCMFSRSFFELRHQLDLSAFFEKSEWEVTQELRNKARCSIVAPLMEGVFGPRRALHKRVLEFSEHQSPELYRLLAGRPYGELVGIMERLTQRLAAITGLALGPTDLLIDAPPVHKEVEFRVTIWSPKTGVYQPLQDVSPVVDALARTQFDDFVKRVRLFAKAEWKAALQARPNIEEELAASARGE